jgi:hypothetical protein
MLVSAANTFGKNPQQKKRGACHIVMAVSAQVDV